MTSSGLAGRRILVTRAARQSGMFSKSLQALGAIPVEVPLLEMVPPESWEPLDEALRQMHTYDWLILTSGNTLDALRERAAALGLHPERTDNLQVAAVGRATALLARQAGYRITVVPEMQVAEGLVTALGEAVQGKRILLPRAAQARDVIPEALAAGGADVDAVIAYRNRMPDDAPTRLRAAYEGGLDAAAFTSSSSVLHLAEAADRAGLTVPFAGVPSVSIGPVTSETLRGCGWAPVREADPHDVEGLVQALREAFNS